MSFARDGRVALCELLDETGPEAPTLCEGWQTLDLAAHLVMRQRRPDAAAGVMGGPLAGHTERVRRGLIATTPYVQLVDEIRNGPPRLSVFRIPGMDERLNTVEYFVHHEDVRRGGDGWEPRDIGAGPKSATEPRRNPAPSLPPLSGSRRKKKICELQEDEHDPDIFRHVAGHDVRTTTRPF